MNELAIQELSNSDLIRSRIFTIRGIQVMLDRDLAELYGVATKALNQAVKRNIERFPERYMFQLNKDDVANMRSQIETLNSDNPGSILRSQIVTSRWGGTRYLPYAFTEHGIIMLASVLNSPTAVEASVRITDTFVAMRRALASIAPLLSRIEATERRQLKLEDSQVRNEERFKLILDAMQDKKFPPQKVFFDGQVYDAFEQMKKFIRMAKKELIIIDPYFADSVLPLLAQK
ncbi:MAG: ORF6N domain-containing protein, partial [Kiritimatiellae bacterium]|nr:ORF6N domain-containing protein [Kiritimatiellia bacterium]